MANPIGNRFTGIQAQMEILDALAGAASYAGKGIGYGYRGLSWTKNALGLSFDPLRIAALSGRALKWGYGFSGRAREFTRFNKAGMARSGFAGLWGMAPAHGPAEEFLWGTQGRTFSKTLTTPSAPWSRPTPGIPWGLKSTYTYSTTRTVPGFFSRSASQHLTMGLTRGIQSLHPMWLGVEAIASGAFALADTEDHLLTNPYAGVGRKFVGNVGMAPGIIAGGAAGAALGTAAIPVPFIGTAVGFLAGTVIGSLAGSQVADIPWKIATIGRNMRVKRSGEFFGGGYVDSEYAATMRQRSMAMIYQSGMNARSSLGSESLGYHG